MLRGKALLRYREEILDNAQEKDDDDSGAQR